MDGLGLGAADDFADGEELADVGFVDDAFEQCIDGGDGEDGGGAGELVLGGACVEELAAHGFAELWEIDETVECGGVAGIEGVAVLADSTIGGVEVDADGDAEEQDDELFHVESGCAMAVGGLRVGCEL